MSILSFLLAISGCTTGSSSPLTPADCMNCVGGFDRLKENAESRGVDFIASGEKDTYECLQIPGGVVASDMDADGDIDLLFRERAGFPALYKNDGTGQFEKVLVDLDVEQRWGRRILSLSTADLDGDGLPEVILGASSLVLLSRNLGGMQFSDFEVVIDKPDYPRTCYNTLVVGDVDGDRDLDLALPGLDYPDGPDFIPQSEDAIGSPDELWLNDQGHFRLWGELVRGDRYGLSVLAFFTDRDGDRDMDLFVASDRTVARLPSSGFYRNDGLDGQGLPILVNDVTEVGMDMPLSGMGFTSWDENKDSLPDYCMGDIGSTIRCFVSDRQWGYIDATAALGLTTDFEVVAEQVAGQVPLWSTWGVEAVDLENDGDLDFLALAGVPPDGGSVGHSELEFPQPNAVWERMEDHGYVERSLSFAGGTFAPPGYNYSSVMADLSRDGYPELIVGVWEGMPQIWDNPCGEFHWLTVDLVGAGDNVEGLGARIELQAGEHEEMRELHALRSLGQGPSEFYFGLGNTTMVDRIQVVWPDGELQEIEDISVDQVLKLVHPDAG